MKWLIGGAEPDFRTISDFRKDNIDSIFSQNTEMELRNLCILHLMLDAGLLSEEVVTLKVCGSDFDKSYIRILDSKNHNSRIVPLAWDLKIYLQCYLEFQEPAPAPPPAYVCRGLPHRGGIY